MSFELWLTGSLQLLPAQAGWIILLALGFAFAFAQSLPRFEDYLPSRFLAALLWILAAFPLACFFYVSFPSTGAPAIPGVPLPPAAPIAGLLGIAWILLAGAYLGRLPALMTGLAVGVVRTLLDTHQMGTAVEYALFGWAAAWFLRQDYAGLAFAFLRRPAGAAFAGGLFLTLLRFGGEMGSTQGGIDPVTAFDYALGRLPGQFPAIVLECAAGAAIVELIRLLAGRRWPAPRKLRSTRYHRNLSWKLSLWLTVPIAAMALALTTIVVVDARAQAEDALRAKIRSVADVALTNIPIAVNTGHTLLEGMAGGLGAADPLAPDVIVAYLGERIRHPAFFEQIAYLQAGNSSFSVYPSDSGPYCVNAEEAQGCSLALRGIAWQGWIPSADPQQPWISFTQPVFNAQGNVTGALIGRTSLKYNQLLLAVANAFRSLPEGQGLILDSSNQVVYPRQAEPWSAGAPAETDAAGGSWFFGTMPGGGTRLSYLLPLGYPDWQVAVRTSEADAFRSALATGLHIGLFALLMLLLTEALVLLIARQIISPLRALAGSAGMIADGDLERFVPVGGEDEIGRLGRSLETMRRNLRREMRDEELLLTTVQEMSAAPDLARAMDGLLRGVRSATGAQGVRVVLVPGLRERQAGVPLALGEAAEALAGADDRILARVAAAAEGAGAWTTGRGAEGEDDLPSTVGGLAAVRIARAGAFYGALCIVYGEAHAFEVGLIDLLAGFAGQAALSIANALLMEGTEAERQQLAAILEAIPEGVLVVDSERALQYANPTAEDMLGVPLRGFGRPVTESLPIPELAALLSEIAPQPRGLDFAAAGGRRLQGVVRSVRSTEGGLWQVCVLQDVTRFRELDALKSEFVHTVSHDLRRPLTMIEGQVHMIEMLGPLNPAQEEYARRVRVSAQNMNRLVKDLLDLGRVESGVEIRLAPVKIAEVVRRVVEELKPEASSGNIKVQVEVPESLPEVPADVSLLERALGNLLENAIRFNRTGGSVHIGANVSRGLLVIAIRDSGIGIAPADQPRIFERFYRVAPRDDPEHPAWGLGLTIVQSVAEWHKGKVWFESKLGQGSTFYFALPLRQG